MSYKVQDFKDRIVDDSGNVVQEGTKLQAQHLQKMESALLINESNIDAMKKEQSLISHPLYGLTVLCLGDSITIGQGMSAATRWNTVLANKYNWNLTVQAQGGISLSSYYYTTNSASDASIAKRAEKISSMSPKPDIVLVWGGHNDVSYRYSPLGAWTDSDSNSFRGALKYISNLVYKNAPKAALFVLTREWTTFDPSPLKVPTDTTDTSADFDKAVFEGAYLYGWTPINMQLCGINPYTKSSYTGDGIHPNASGTELIVSYLESELTKHYRVPDLDKVSVTSIELNKSVTTILKGETETLITKVSPSNATNTSIQWSSSSNNIATVNSSGVVTAIAEGSATITAKTNDGGLIASCIINVSNNTVAVIGIALDKTQHTCQQSTEFTLDETISPNNATNQNIIWSSSDENVAIVSGGFVKALREGDVVITATTADGGYKATCNLTVTV